MKKVLLLILVIVLIFGFVGCSYIARYIPIKEYTETPLSSLSYKTVDYMGGYTETYTLDFVSNTVTKSTFSPWLEDTEEESEIIARFTEDEERDFINKIYSYGLFNIKEHYEPDYTVMDGGGWSLVVNYSDGTSKKSTGNNASPKEVFNNCAIPFYDLCGEQVIGYVPTTYISPPRVDLSVSYTYKNYNFSGNTVTSFTRGNYLWNGHREGDADIYEIAIGDKGTRFLRGQEYEISLYTSNYNNYNGKYDKFSKCTVTSFSLDPELSDGKQIVSTGWFSSINIPYEPDRIFLVTLEFNNGDFVDYIFSTATLDQKIYYGEYDYNIYNEGKSALTINEDGSFSLSPFDYFEESDRAPGEAKGSLVGSWAFETLSGAEYLVLTATSGERLVLDYCAKALFVDFDKTTLDLSRYNLQGDPNYMQGRVSFNKH